jgi:hypothetical protein
MSALPNPLKPQPGSSKPPKAGKLNRYGRDPLSPSEKMRVSDYEAEKGYSPLFHSFLADIPRLTSGNSCTVLMLSLWAKSAGRGYAKGKTREEWTPELSVTDLAQICRCDERTIERELRALNERGLGEVKREGKGKITARLLYRQWEALPDYQPKVVEMKPPTEEPEAVIEPEPKAAGYQLLTGKKPLTVRAGALSRAIPLTCGVKTVQFQSPGTVDILFECVIQAGEAVVKASVPDAWLESLQKRLSSPSVSNDLTPGTRHARRGNDSNHSDVVIDPKAAELGAVFDPLLKKSQARLLSADSIALAAACAEYHGLNKQDLISFLTLGSDPRAARPISSPKACVAIIKEARLNYERSGSIPDVSQPSGKQRKEYVPRPNAAKY